MTRVLWRGAVTLVLAAGAAHAQGTISSQGFGYPTGQLSGAARGSGGAGAEMDPNSPINPAAIARANRFSISLLFEPESRTTTVGGNDQPSNVVRFPGFSFSGGIQRFVFGASVSSLLDRTWDNQYADSLLVDGTWTPMTTSAGSDGAISDSRLSAAYIISPRLQVGIGYHAVLGENRTTFIHDFADTSGNLDIRQDSRIKYRGSAWSLGVVGEPVRNLIVGASLRTGRDLLAELDGSPTPGEGTVPSRIGLGATWVGIAGVVFNARYDQVNWSTMDDLGSTDVTTFDTREFAAGVEALGPRVAGTNSVLRLGLRDRTLPFGVSGNQVSERGVTGGIGFPVGRGGAQVDLALERALRRVGSAKENAWILAIGFGIRP